MRPFLFASLLFLSAPAAGEVVSADAHGFEVVNSVSLDIPVGEAYAAFGRVGDWWSDSHTYSGKAANMKLPLQAGGCFCETLPENGGGVEHLRVALVQPGERIVMTGPLGPVLFQAAAGVMDVRFESSAGGTKVTLNYRAAGFAKGNANTLAAPVDAVIAEQLKRFAAYAAK